jgi:hypothetical protein
MTTILPLLLSAALLPAPAAPATPPDARTSTPQFGAVLTGTVGARPVEMYLEGDAWDDLGESTYSLWGYYFYTKPGAFARAPVDGLSLEGHIDKDGRMEIDERTYVEPTGRFVGRLVVDTSSGRPVVRIDGTWTSAKGGRALPFSLAEPRHAKVAYRVASKSIAESTPEPGEDDEDAPTLEYKIECEVPRLSGAGPAADAAFNRLVDERIAKEIATFKEDATQPVEEGQDSSGLSFLNVHFDVAYMSPTLVSIRFHEYYSPYWYLAWSLRTRWGLTFDLATGREVTLDEALGPGGERERWRLLERLGKGREWETSTLADDGKSSIGWNVREDGLSLYYLADRREGGNVELFVPRPRGAAPLTRPRR